MWILSFSILVVFVLYGASYDFDWKESFFGGGYLHKLCVTSCKCLLFMPAFSLVSISNSCRYSSFERVYISLAFIHDDFLMVLSIFFLEFFSSSRSYHGFPDSKTGKLKSYISDHVGVGFLFILNFIFSSYCSSSFSFFMRGNYRFSIFVFTPIDKQLVICE